MKKLLAKAFMKGEKTEEELAEEAAVKQKEAEKAAIETGFGKYEYANGSTYVGNWIVDKGRKVKHGHGKMVKPGLSFAGR